jgi:anti-sigma factor RsiW
MHCPNEETISAYLDNSLEDKEAGDLFVHIRHCPDCSGRMQELQKLGAFESVPATSTKECACSDKLCSFLDGRMSLDEEEAFVRHLSSCSFCRKASLEYRRLTATAAEDLPEVPARVIAQAKTLARRAPRTARPVTRKTETRGWVLPVAAAAALALVAVIFGVHSSSNPLDRPQRQNPTKPNARVSEGPKVADRGPAVPAPPGFPGDSPKPVWGGEDTGATVEPAPQPAPPSEKPVQVPPKHVEEPGKPTEVTLPTKPTPRPSDVTAAVPEARWDRVLLKPYALRRRTNAYLDETPAKLNCILDRAGHLLLGPNLHSKVTIIIRNEVLHIDLNGDGRRDQVIGRNGGQILFKVLRGDGRPDKVSLHLSRRGDQWFVRNGAYLAGRMYGQVIALVDENNNGSFCDLGVDSISVGDLRLRAYLGRVISVDGRLYEFKLNRCGREARFRPYTGATGTLDVYAGFLGKAKIKSVVVASEDCSFNLAAIKKDSPLPADTYRLVQARLSARKKEITVWGGTRTLVTVQPQEANVLRWGGPLRVDFCYRRTGALLQIRHRDLTFYGRAGEVYVIRNGKALPAPKAQVRATKTGKFLKETTLGTGVSFQDNGRSVPGTAVPG